MSVFLGRCRFRFFFRFFFKVGVDVGFGFSKNRDIGVDFGFLRTLLIRANPFNDVCQSQKRLIERFTYLLMSRTLLTVRTVTVRRF